MLATAQLVAVRAMPPCLVPPAYDRGSNSRRLRAPDLLAFSRGPLRWLLTPEEEPQPVASLAEVFRMALLAPQTFAANYVGRPSTYSALVNTCPRCGSIGSGLVCKKDGTRRANVAVQKPWSNAATVCDSWTRNAQDAGRRIVPPDILASLGTAVSATHADPTATAYLEDANTLLEIHGTWNDEPTGQDILLATTVHIAPPANSTDGNSLGHVSVTSDASPGTWQLRAFHSGRHVKAALDLALYNKAFSELRNTYRWLDIEKTHPAVFARRAAEPSLIAAGSEQLAHILAAIAKCRAAGVYPGFDGTDLQGNSTWSTIGIEPWMGSQNGTLPMPFAVQACATLAA
jgi:hypothetical protein